MNLASLSNAQRFSVKIVDIDVVDRLDRWCRFFGVTPNQLRTAVSTVGRNPDIIRRYLRYGAHSVR